MGKPNSSPVISRMKFNAANPVVIPMPRPRRNSWREAFGLSYSEMPADYQDNKYLHGGYRHPELGWRKTIRSVCVLHNETLNVWTHILGLVIALVSTILTLMMMSPYGFDHLPSVWSSLRDQPLLHHASDVLMHTSWDPFSKHSSDESTDTCPNVLPDEFGLQTLSTHEERFGVCYMNKEDRVQKLLSYMYQNNAYMRSLVEIFTVSNTSNNTAPTLSPSEATKKLLPVVPPNSLHLYVSALSDAMYKFKQAIIHAAYVEESDVEEEQESIESLQQRLDSIKETLAQHVHDMLLMSDTDEETQDDKDSPFSSLMSSLHVIEDDILHVTETILSSFHEYMEELNQNQHMLSDKLYNASLSTYPSSLSNLLSPYSLQQSQTGVLKFLPLWPFAVYMATAMCCFAFSATYHLFLAVSPAWSIKFQSLDYAGITLLIGGNHVPFLYYGFYCLPTYRTFYLGLMFCASCAGFFVIFSPKYFAPQYRGLRAVIFLSMGFSGAISICHLILYLGETPSFFWYMLGMGAAYLLGAFVYLVQIPERCAPGKFDILAHSHQWWHVCIIIAVMIEYYGVLDMFQWRITRECPAL